MGIYTAPVIGTIELDNAVHDGNVSQKTAKPASLITRVTTGHSAIKCRVRDDVAVRNPHVHRPAMQTTSSALLGRQSVRNGETIHNGLARAIDYALVQAGRIKDRLVASPVAQVEFSIGFGADEPTVQRDAIHKLDRFVAGPGIDPDRIAIFGCIERIRDAIEGGVP